MKKGITLSLAVLSIFLLMFFVSGVKATEISSCVTISSSGYYNLTQDINFTNSSVDFAGCFDIQTDNVILDGMGHTLNYNGSYINDLEYITAYGHRNITIKNFNVAKDNCSTQAYFFVARSHTNQNNINLENINVSSNCIEKTWMLLDVNWNGSNITIKDCNYFNSLSFWVGNSTDQWTFNNINIDNCVFNSPDSGHTINFYGADDITTDVYVENITITNGQYNCDVSGVNFLNFADYIHAKNVSVTNIDSNGDCNIYVKYGDDFYLDDWRTNGPRINVGDNGVLNNSYIEDDVGNGQIYLYDNASIENSILPSPIFNNNNVLRNDVIVGNLNLNNGNHQHLYNITACLGSVYAYPPVTPPSVYIDGLTSINCSTAPTLMISNSVLKNLNVYNMSDGEGRIYIRGSDITINGGVFDKARLTLYPENDNVSVYNIAFTNNPSHSDIGFSGQYYIDNENITIDGEPLVSYEHLSGDLSQDGKAFYIFNATNLNIHDMDIDKFIAIVYADNLTIDSVTMPNGVSLYIRYCSDVSLNNISSSSPYGVQVYPLCEASVNNLNGNMFFAMYYGGTINNTNVIGDESYPILDADGTIVIENSNLTGYKQGIAVDFSDNADITIRNSTITRLVKEQMDYYGTPLNGTISTYCSYYNPSYGYYCDGNITINAYNSNIDESDLEIKDDYGNANIVYNKYWEGYFYNPLQALVEIKNSTATITSFTNAYKIVDILLKTVVPNNSVTTYPFNYTLHAEKENYNNMTINLDSNIFNYDIILTEIKHSIFTGFFVVVHSSAIIIFAIAIIMITIELFFFIDIEFNIKNIFKYITNGIILLVILLIILYIFINM